MQKEFKVYDDDKNVTCVLTNGQHLVIPIVRELVLELIENLKTHLDMQRESSQ